MSDQIYKFSSTHKVSEMEYFDYLWRYLIEFISITLLTVAEMRVKCLVIYPNQSHLYLNLCNQ